MRTDGTAVLLLLTILLCAVPLHAQSTWYVDDDAPGDPGPGDPAISDPLEDGSTDHPFDSIMEGYMAIGWGGDTVLVRDGLYTGEGNRDIGVQRERRVTIKSENGPENCIIDCQGGEADPHRAFDFANYGARSTVEGFTITGGWSPDSGTWSGGGAIRVIQGPATIRGNIFIDNWCGPGEDGGAIQCREDTEAEIIGNVFIDNHAYTGGGAIYYQDAQVVIVDNEFIANIIDYTGTQESGCAIYGWMWDEQKRASITGNIFSGHDSGSAVIYIVHAETDVIGNTFTDNGVLCMQFDKSPSLIRDNQFTGNTEGCIYSRYDHSGAPYNSEVYVIGNTFIDNAAERGAGVNCASGGSVIKDNLFSGNHATITGGAIFISSASWSVLNNGIEENSAGGNGGGLAFSSYHGTVAGNRIERNHAAGRGGGIYTSGWSSQVVNNLIVGNSADGEGGGIGQEADYIDYRLNTIAGNQAADGGGIYVNSEVYWSTTVTDTVIWGNMPNQYHLAYAPAAASYCDVQGGAYGESIIDADPLFTVGLVGEHNLASTAAGQPVDSPCVDTGSEPADTVMVPVDFDLDTLTLIEWPASTLTTRTDRVGDTGQVDMGYHYPIEKTISCELSCQPAGGALPFVSQFTVSMANDYRKLARRIQYQMDVTLAGGQDHSSWRRGWQNVQPGESFGFFWGQNLPALEPLAGDNDFLLTVLDVTPPPYNLPPYLPSGDTDTAACTVTGWMP